MFRRKRDELEVLLVHPGGPYFRNKDDGAWTIPKGEAGEGEDLQARARIEFEEELGITPAEAGWIDLGTVKQKGGKTVHAWAFEGDCDPASIVSNTFRVQWPYKSGKWITVPEIDRAAFFGVKESLGKINPAQADFVTRLRDTLAKEQPPPGGGP